VKLERIKKLSLKTYAIALIIAFFAGLVLGGAIVYSQSSNENITIDSGSFTKDDFFVSYSEWQACSQDSVFQNETLTAIKAVSSTTITLGLTNPTPVWQVQGEGKNVTWYFRADTHTVNGILGYRLDETASSSDAYDIVSTEGASITYYGVRVWIVHSSGALEELTGGQPVAVVSRNADGEGLQTATWNCPGYSNIIDAIMIKVYQRFGTDEWNLRATFITENETLIKLPEATWTFTYYTKRSYMSEVDSGITISMLYWGGNYQTKVQLKYTEPTPYELMLWKLQNRDIFGFIMLPFTYWLGFMAYGIVFLLPLGIGLYKIFDDFKATILGLLLIGGGAGGIISMLIPQSGLQLSWILFVLGIAGILWSLVKGK